MRGGGIKLSLDTDALTKLFENLDNEVILHIKQAVVEETCRRTIHAVVPEEIRKIVERLAQKEIKEQVGYYDYSQCSVYLNPNVRDTMTDLVKKVVSKEVDNFINVSKIEKQIAQEEKEIQQQVNKVLLDLRGNIFLEIASKINEGISKYITDEVNKRLEEVMGKNLTNQRKDKNE